jgi:hypothetical protein
MTEARGGYRVFITRCLRTAGCSEKTAYGLRTLRRKGESSERLMKVAHRLYVETA